MSPMDLLAELRQFSTDRIKVKAWLRRTQLSVTSDFYRGVLPCPACSIPWCRKPSWPASAWWRGGCRAGGGCTGCPAVCRCSQRCCSSPGAGTPASSSAGPDPSACTDGYFCPAKHPTFTPLQTDRPAIPINYWEQTRFWLKGNNQVKDRVLEWFLLADAASTSGQHKTIQGDIIYFALELLSLFHGSTITFPEDCFQLVYSFRLCQSCREGLLAKTCFPWSLLLQNNTEAFTFVLTEIKYENNLWLGSVWLSGCSLEGHTCSLSHISQGNPSWETSPCPIRVICVKNRLQPRNYKRSLLQLPVQLLACHRKLNSVLLYPSSFHE